MGTSVGTFSPEIPGTNNIVSPYGADINPDVAGTVRYTNFIYDSSQLSTVSTLIRSQNNNYFSGTKMMIAEWNSVAEFSGNWVSLCLHLYASHFVTLGWR